MTRSAGQRPYCHYSMRATACNITCLLSPEQERPQPLRELPYWNHALVLSAQNEVLVSLRQKVRGCLSQQAEERRSPSYRAFASGGTGLPGPELGHSCYCEVAKGQRL